MFLKVLMQRETTLSNDNRARITGTFYFNPCSCYDMELFFLNWTELLDQQRGIKWPLAR